MFGHPNQAAHMMSGVKAAIASPKTPPHLKAHLQKRVMKATPLPQLTVPPAQNSFPAGMPINQRTAGKTAALPIVAPVKPKKKYPAIFGGPR